MSLHHVKLLAMIFLATALSTPSFAQSKKLKLDKNLPLKIDYNFPSWNSNPNETDSAVVIFRDADSGKYAKVNLEETENNSGTFVGVFSINWSSTGEVAPELFVPPQGIAKKEKIEALSSMIEKGELTRKPFFLRKEGGQQLLTVYNSKDQALAAFENFRKNVKGTPIVDNAALEAQKRAEVAAEVARLAALAASQELQRQKMAALELARVAELKKQAEALSAAEKQSRIDKAAKLAAEALALYRKESFPAAEDKFRKAIELDPENKTFFFQYGVTLYKNGKCDDSLVALDFANDPAVNQFEKNYFKGLCHMKLKEYKAAKTDFSEVKKLGDDKMAPAAAFFLGVIHFSEEEYKPAKTQFEYTLDKSTDPKLDAQAENYIDQIANIEQFLEKKARPFTFTISGGLQHDSNVLLVSDASSGGTSLDTSGIRGVANSSLDYRMIYNETHEFMATLSYNDIYTTDSSLQATAELQNADPLVLGFKLPYKYKGMMFGKGYQLTLAPGYETISLNADGESPRELILSSIYLSTDQTFVVSPNYFTNLGIDIRNDDSQLEGSLGTDSDAVKVTLSSENTFFQDAKKTEAYLFGALLEQNTAKGDDSIYSKLGVNGGYLTPFYWDTSVTGTISYNITTYPKHSSDRVDNELGLNAGLSKPLTPSLIGMLAYTYTNNQSTVESSTYSKFTLTALLNWTVNF